MIAGLVVAARQTPPFRLTVTRRLPWSAIAVVLKVESFMTPSGQPSAIHCRTSSCRALIGAVGSIAKDSITTGEAEQVHLRFPSALNTLPLDDNVARLDSVDQRLIHYLWLID